MKKLGSESKAPLPAGKSGEVTSSGITYSQIWWTSTWPLLLVTFVGTVLSGDSSVGQRPAVGAAFLWGSILAGLYAKRPVLTFGQAFKMSAQVAVPTHLVLGLVLYLVWTQSVGGEVSLGELLFAVTLSAVIWCAAWALFIVRKGKKLMQRSGRVAPTASGISRPALEQEASLEGAAVARDSLDAGQQPRSGINNLMSSGWARLFVVVWAAWAAWRWMIIDDQAGYSWRSDEYTSFAFQAVLAPIALLVAAWWVRQGFVGPGARKRP